MGIRTFSFKKMHLTMSSVKWRSFCLGLNVLKALFVHVGPDYQYFPLKFPKLSSPGTLSTPPCYSYCNHLGYVGRGFSSQWRIMITMASQITSISIVYSTVLSGADQRKHQSSASLAFVRVIHRCPVNYPHKGPVTWKMFPFDDVIMCWWSTGKQRGKPFWTILTFPEPRFPGDEFSLTKINFRWWHGYAYIGFHMGCDYLIMPLFMWWFLN